MPAAEAKATVARSVEQTKPGKDGFLWQLYHDDGDREVTLQRACGHCDKGMLLTPARFCGSCGGSGYKTRAFRLKLDEDEG